MSRLSPSTPSPSLSAAPQLLPFLAFLCHIEQNFQTPGELFNFYLIRMRPQLWEMNGAELNGILLLSQYRIVSNWKNWRGKMYNAAQYPFSAVFKLLPGRFQLLLQIFQIDSQLSIFCLINLPHLK